MSTNKVLIITYYWPPAGGPGVQRMLKFVKYLREFNWEPIVLTVENGTYPSKDESLLLDIPSGTEVIKTKTFEPFELYNTLKGKKDKKEVSIGLIGLDKKSTFQQFSNYVRANYFIPDARKGWNKHAFRAAKQAIISKSITAVITTGPPHSTHLIGKQLKEKLDIKWIADFRDPWTNIFYNKFFNRSAATERKDKSLEDSVVKSSDFMTVATPGLKDEFQDRSQSIEVLYNGFDESDISSTKPASSEKFVISYIGNYKPNQNVPKLWEAITQLKQQGLINAQNFELHFTGKIDPGVQALLTDSEIQDLIVFEDYIPHQEAVKQMQSANLLLFVIPNEKHNHLILTGKIFEYIACLSPILAIGPVEGNAGDILQKSGRDKMLDYSDLSGIKNQLEKYVDEWLKNEKQPFKFRTDEALMQYSRKELTRKLSIILNQITNG